jgi:hypothetical protein
MDRLLVMCRKSAGIKARHLIALSSFVSWLSSIGGATISQYRGHTVSPDGIGGVAAYITSGAHSPTGAVSVSSSPRLPAMEPCGFGAR